MSAINEALLPAFLFVVYFLLAIKFLLQMQSAMVIETEEVEAYTSSQERNRPTLVILQQQEYTNDLANPLISRDWLETQSLANLKAIAAELCITPIGDKRSKLTWINAIASTTPENTVLAVNLCYA